MSRLIILVNDPRELEQKIRKSELGKERWPMAGLSQWVYDCCGQPGTNQAGALWGAGQIVPENRPPEGWKRGVFIFQLASSVGCCYPLPGLIMWKCWTDFCNHRFSEALEQKMKETWFSQKGPVSLHPREAGCLSNRWSKSWAEKIWAEE